MDTLADKEFNQFMTHFIKTSGRNAISTLLRSSAPALKNNENKSINQHIDSAINITKSIIRSREDQPGSELTQSRLDTLPSAIMGDIGSYLPQKDYASFSTTNRAIYVDHRKVVGWWGQIG